MSKLQGSIEWQRPFMWPWYQTRPNQVRTLTFIKGLFQHFSTLKILQITCTFPNIQLKKMFNHFMQMNKMFKCSFKWTKSSTVHSSEQNVQMEDNPSCKSNSKNRLMTVKNGTKIKSNKSRHESRLLETFLSYDHFCLFNFRQLHEACWQKNWGRLCLFEVNA